MTRLLPLISKIKGDCNLSSRCLLCHTLPTHIQSAGPPHRQVRDFAGWCFVRPCPSAKDCMILVIGPRSSAALTRALPENPLRASIFLFSSSHLFSIHPSFTKHGSSLAPSHPAFSPVRAQGPAKSTPPLRTTKTARYDHLHTATAFSALQTPLNSTTFSFSQLFASSKS